MITRYRKYLEILDSKLEKMFKAQAPFIKCHKGCAYCCKEGEYPLSELEYVNLMFYYNLLDNDTKSKINDNISKLLSSERKKMYECPFLINDECSVYPARAIICRTFGLISFDDNDKKRMPFCVDLNLNYSDSFDKDTRKLTKKADDGTEPLAYNISRKVLRSSQIEKDFDVFFGEDKALIEWLASDDLS